MTTFYKVRPFFTPSTLLSILVLLYQICIGYIVGWGRLYRVGVECNCMQEQKEKPKQRIELTRLLKKTVYNMRAAVEGELKAGRVTEEMGF